MGRPANGAFAHPPAPPRPAPKEGLPYTIFQPLYIYGPHTAKDCEQWFVDRVIRCADAEGGVTALRGQRHR